MAFAGEALVEPGSRIVSGTAPFSAEGLAPGWLIAFGDVPDRRYPIDSVDVEGLTLTLTLPWQGPAATPLAYVLTPGGWPLMAPVPWYREGTIDVTAGAGAVTGHGTGWAGVITAGDMLVLGGRLYEIATVTSNTEAVLAVPYDGSTAEGVDYAIVRMITNTTAAALAVQLSRVVHAFGVRDSEFRAWVAGIATGGENGDGRYPLTGTDGVTRQVPCPAAWQASGGSGGGGMEIGYDGIITTGGSRRVLDFRGAADVVDDSLYQRARVTIGRSEPLAVVPAPDMAPLAEAVCRPQTKLAAGTLAVDGSEAVDGTVHWDGCAHRIMVAGGDGAIEVTGVDQDGAGIVETISPDAQGAVWWREITRIMATTAITTPVSVGRTGTKVLVDAAAAGVISVTLPEQDVAIRLVGPPAGGRTRDVTLHTCQPATARAIAWEVPPGWALVWPARGGPPRPGDAGQRVVWRFHWLDGAGTGAGTIVGSQDVAPLGVGDLGTPGGQTITIDAGIHSVYSLTLPDADCTIDLIGAPNSGYRRELLLTLRQPATARGVTFAVESGWVLLWDNSLYQPGVGAANRRSVWRFIWNSSMMSVIGSRVFIEWNGLPQPSPPTVIFDNNNKAPQYVSVSSDGLSVTAGQSSNNYHYGIRLTNPVSMKSYCEFKVSNSGGGRAIGLARSNWDFESSTNSSVGLGKTNHTWGYHHSGDIKYNGAVTMTSEQYTYNDIIMIAFDPNTGSGGKLWFGKNGVWIGNPGSGSNPCFSDISGTLGTLFFAMTGSGAKITALQSDPSRWLFPPPAGFGPVQ